MKRLEKIDKFCKKCQNFEHIHDSHTDRYDCKLSRYECSDNTYKSPMFKEIEDETARKEASDEYDKWLNNIKETHAKEEKIGSIIGSVMVISYAMAIWYMIIYSVIYWIGHDYLTTMQVAKYIVQNNPIVFWYIVIMSVILTIVQMKS